MRKAIIVLCMLLCATAVFARTLTLQAGFSTLGANAGVTYHIDGTTKVGLNASAAMGNGIDWIGSDFRLIFGQALVSFDVLQSPSNDLDMRVGAAYLRMGERYYTDEGPYMNYMDAICVTFGIQYTHWFGEKMAHGIYVGTDLPLGGYAGTNGFTEDASPFFGPLSSATTLGVLAATLRFGYAFQF